MQCVIFYILPYTLYWNRTMSALGNGALSALNLRLDIHKNVYNNIHLLMASNSLLLWRASGLVMYLLVVCLYIYLSLLSLSPPHISFIQCYWRLVLLLTWASSFYSFVVVSFPLFVNRLTVQQTLKPRILSLWINKKWIFRCCRGPHASHKTHTHTHNWSRLSFVCSLNIYLYSKYSGKSFSPFIQFDDFFSTCLFYSHAICQNFEYLVLLQSWFRTHVRLRVCG